MLINRLVQYFFNALVIIKTVTGDYKFTLREYIIYFKYAESPGPQNKYPTVQIIGGDDTFVKLKIGTHIYFWPRTFDLYGLAYMHQEVYAPSSNNFHAYEHGPIQVKCGDVVIDAGACEGFFTRYALEKGAKIITIEPVKILADALKRTFLNEIKNGQVSLHNVAIGSCNTQGYLSMDSTKIFESHLSMVGECVDIVKLDDFITTKVDFIKMDIEGGEVDAVYGAHNIIKLYKPRLAIAVYHNYENAQKIMEYLYVLCPEYTIKYRGIYAYNNEKPRPMMVYAW